MEELIGMWGMLSRRKARNLSTGKLSISIGDRQLVAAVDRIGAIHVLIPHPEANDISGLWRSAAITLSRVNFSGDDSVVYTWLDLHCKQPELEPVFVRLAVAVIERLLLVPVVALQTACIDELNSWRELFGMGRHAEESVTGLLGELLLIERLSRIDPSKAWDAWTGPRGGRHDFRHGSNSIEVKTTTQRTGRFVQIHGIQQLQEPDGGGLHLVFTRLEHVPSGNLTISGMVERLICNGIDRTGIMDVLVDLGIPDLHCEASKRSFELIETLWFQVGENFPRIIPPSFVSGAPKAGVLEVMYGIDLSTRTSIQKTEVDSVIRDFMDT